MNADSVVLLDAQLRPAGRLYPAALRLEETFGGIATARLNLTEEEAAGLRAGSWLRLRDGAGRSAGCFRVEGLRRLPEDGLCVCEAVHALGQLRQEAGFDPLEPPAGAGWTLREMARQLLQRQSGSLWSLGSWPEGNTWHAAFGEESLWEALLRAAALAGPAFGLGAETDSLPFRLHLLPRPESLCDLRTDRNLCALRLTEGGEWATRLYPLGRDGLSIRAVNGQSPCLDAASLPALGVRAAVRQWGRLNDPQMLKDTAAAWLAAHDRPQTGCEAEVLCRWEESGDPADLPAAGGRCRIHTNSGVLQGRITKLSWTDLREDPRRLRLSIALDAG